MTAAFERVTTYGQPVFRGPGAGSLWRHRCGNMTTGDLLADGGYGLPWLHECAGCRGTDRDGWQPLYAYTGPLCDQCAGNGWVPISGHLDVATCGLETVTECLACGGQGIAT